MKRFQPGERHPTVYNGSASVNWDEHRANWVLERWTVRERGVTLFGPDPKSLIDPISPDQLREAVRARLRGWRIWAAQPDDPAWLLRRASQAYVVETMCRALYTLVCGELSSKSRAAAWALETLPEPWRGLVDRTQAGRASRKPDPSTVAEVLRFVDWAASDGETTLAV